ncbi:MAG: Na+/H+ antiporter subunit E [Pseudomonadota bacterium]
MLNAAALLACLWALWLLILDRWTRPETLAAAGAAALLCVLLAARLGALGGPGPYGALPRLFFLRVGRVGAVLAGAVATLRAALAPDLKLRPALVRVRTREASALAQAEFATLINVAPGAVVVAADDSSLLVHALQEDAVDALALTDLEARVIGALDGRRLQ